MKRETSNMQQKAGFTLIEVMVSLAILSVGLVLILSSFMRSIRAKELSEDYFKAGLLLEEKLYEVCELHKKTNIAGGSTSGDFPNFTNRFSWEMDVVEFPADHINEVDLEVSWEQGTKKHSIAVQTCLYIP